jgi:hypothetical protein
MRWINENEGLSFHSLYYKAADVGIEGQALCVWLYQRQVEVQGTKAKTYCVKRSNEMKQRFANV